MVTDLLGRKEDFLGISLSGKGMTGTSNFLLHRHFCMLLHLISLMSLV